MRFVLYGLCSGCGWPWAAVGHRDETVLASGQRVCSPWTGTRPHHIPGTRVRCRGAGFPVVRTMVREEALQLRNELTHRCDANHKEQDHE